MYRKHLVVVVDGRAAIDLPHASLALEPASTNYGGGAL